MRWQTIIDLEMDKNAIYVERYKKSLEASLFNDKLSIQKVLSTCI